MVKGPQCQNIKQVPRLLGPVGHIANIVMEEVNHCGVEAMTWMVEADAGNRIKFTLYDFSVGKTKHLTNPDIVLGKPQFSGCHIYAFIKDVDSSHRSQICEGKDRERVIYTSITSRVEVKIPRQPIGSNEHTIKPYFVIKYHGWVLK